MLRRGVEITVILSKSFVFLTDASKDDFNI